MNKTMYRYEQVYWGSYQELVCHEFDVLKETKCGVWIYVLGFTKTYNQDRKFVNLSAGKKWACTTKKEALQQFLYRKETQVRILNSTLEHTKDAIEMANELLKGIEND